jgi:hypothetical protein
MMTLIMITTIIAESTRTCILLDEIEFAQPTEIISSLGPFGTQRASYHSHSYPSLVRVLNQITVIHTTPLCFPKTHLITILPSKT